MLRRCLSALLSAVVLIAGSAMVMPVASANAANLIPPDVKCRSGKVAITFDDGPHKVNTPHLLKLLRKHDAQATFFVTGANATRYPALLRQAVRDGHAVEVHSWDHPDLTRRSDRSVKRQLNLTKRAIRRAIGRNPHLYRPPYGATDARVRKIAMKYGLGEVLWTIDTNDWRGGSAAQIKNAALMGLRKHRENVILMHDAVNNSPRAIKAVPGIVKGLRKKGYCLVPLDFMMPLGSVSARPQHFVENAEGSSVVRVTFRLDGPAQRNGTFRVRSRDGSAVAGVDYQGIDRILKVRRGVRSVTIGLRVFGDPMPNLDRQLTLRLDRPRQLRLATTQLSVTIKDDGLWEESVEQLIGPILGDPARVQS